MKGIPEILFFGSLSAYSLRYRYGNAESQIQPIPRLQRMPGLILLSFSFPFASSPLLHLISPLHHLSLHPLFVPLSSSPQASR